MPTVELARKLPRIWQSEVLALSWHAEPCQQPIKPEVSSSFSPNIFIAPFNHFLINFISFVNNKPPETPCTIKLIRYFTLTKSNIIDPNPPTLLLFADEIIKESGNENVFLRKLDLSSQKSVREFADGILKSEKKIDVLIHNAGYAETFNKKQSEDGIEMTMATNHYGPYLLTHLLIDLLKKSTPCRIVIVASECYRMARVNLEKHLNPLDGMPGYLYYVSKGANIMFAMELAKRLKGSDITVNFLHPGMIDSGIWRNVPFPLSIGMAFMKSFFKTTVEGAQTTLMLACSEEFKGVTGKYFYDCKERGLASYITQEHEHKKLWEESAKIVKLTTADPKI